MPSKPPPIASLLASLSDRDLLLNIIQRLIRIEEGYVTREEWTRSKRFTITIAAGVLVGTVGVVFRLT